MLGRTEEIWSTSNFWVSRVLMSVNQSISTAIQNWIRFVSMLASFAWSYLSDCDGPKWHLKCPRTISLDVRLLISLDITTTTKNGLKKIFCGTRVVCCNSGQVLIQFYKKCIEKILLQLKKCHTIFNGLEIKPTKSL